MSGFERKWLAVHFVDALDWFFLSTNKKQTMI